MKTIHYQVAQKKNHCLEETRQSNSEKSPITKKANQARLELLSALRRVRPALAIEIAKADAIDHEQLNRKAAQLSRELILLNQECDHVLVEYDAMLPSPSGRESTEFDPIKQEEYAPDFWRDSCQTHASKSHRIEIEKRLELAMKRRHEILAELEKIKVQRDAPLFVRMEGASDLIRAGLDRYAAELLLDLICSGFYGLEQLISGDNDTVGFCLKRLTTLHGTAWLDRLIELELPAVANYIRLCELMNESL